MSISGCARFDEEVGKAVASLLPDKPSKVLRQKHIHDSVWGTITLAPHEIAVINTPLVQRLRRIKQLGSTYFVFPGAVHTRFEHTVGVVNQVQKMCEGLRANTDDDDIVDKDELDNLRMAALCHDLGHGPFSHVSEDFFSKMEHFKKATELHPGCGAAEVLSAMIVSSEQMQGFFHLLNHGYKINLDPEFISASILGSLGEDKAYLGEIVHGAFDADKIDYLTRDGLHCGIPINVDSERIFSKVHAEWISGTKRLVGEEGAVPALAQLVHHKHFMHVVVYQHVVSRSFSAMCRIALGQAHAAKTQFNGKAIGSPADFLVLDDEMVLAPGFVEESRAASMFQSMRNRNLYKPAMDFGDKDLGDGGIERLKGDLGQVQKEIAKKARVHDDEVVVDIAKIIDNREAQNMMIQAHGNKETETLDSVMELSKSGAKPFNEIVRHLVFCPEGHVEEVGKAARDVLGLGA